MTDRVEQVRAVQATALKLFKKKNADYGDAFVKFGIVGVLVRIEDKIQRLLTITQNGVTLVSDESLRDTLLDLHNYAAMGITLLDSEQSLHLENNPSHS
jgi:Nucleotide modification associated domain 1